MDGLRIRAWEPALARDFHDINAEWIAGMFTLEATDPMRRRDAPRARCAGEP